MLVANQTVADVPGAVGPVPLPTNARVVVIDRAIVIRFVETRLCSQGRFSIPRGHCRRQRREVSDDEGLKLMALAVIRVAPRRGEHLGEAVTKCIGIARPACTQIILVFDEKRW